MYFLFTLCTHGFSADTHTLCVVRSNLFWPQGFHVNSSNLLLGAIPFYNRIVCCRQIGWSDHYPWRVVIVRCADPPYGDETDSVLLWVVSFGLMPGALFAQLHPGIHQL